MALAAVFVAQATNVPLTLTDYFTLFAVAALTHKGASGITGAAFIALVATLMVIPSIPVAGMALILGIDRFMSMCRATVNVISNGVATLVVSRWENEIDAETLQKNLAELTTSQRPVEASASV
jgi:aerobic C4-dicarboxylate transport protein